jgi:hypothetical protein
LNRQGQFLARVQTFKFGDALFDDLLLAGLYREVGHGKSDFVLERIAVLGDQVAGVAVKCNVIDFTGRA